MTMEEWKNISAPLEIRNGRTTHSRCEVYDIYDTKYGKNFSKIPCRSWEYDNSQYKNSVIEKWNLVCESSWLSSLAGSSYFVGFLVSAIVSGQISDKYGRRPVIISGIALHVTFGILCTFSPYYWMFTVCRFFLSAGKTACNLTFYVYVMEVVGPSYREKVIVTESFFYTTGMLLLTGVSWFLKDWTYIQLCSSLPSIITLLLISFIPESPRWLLTHGRLRKAEDVIRNIMEKNKRHTENLTEIIEELYWKIRTETAKEFQDFTDLIGTFGRWQKILLGVIAWSAIVMALNNLNWPFLAYKVDYWCMRTPKYINMTMEEWKNISAPLEIRNGRTTHSRCEVYDIYDTKYGKNFSKIPCRSWEYDHSQYKNSVIEKWNLVCESSWLSSLAGSSYFVGFLVSAIVSGQISDKYGRRPVIISGIALHVTFGILCTFSPYYWMFTVCRFFLSAGKTACNLTFYVYVMEVVGPSYREKVIVTESFFYTTGMLLLTGVSWFLKDWTYIQLCSSLPSIITLLLISFIPESPRWLLTHGRLRKAEDVIRNIMEKNKKHTENLTEIIEELYWKIRTNENKRKMNFFELIRNKELRKITFLMYILWLVIIFDTYALSLNADITGGNIFIFFVSFSLQYCVSGVLIIILPRFGRRRILMFGCLLVGITSLLIIAVPDDIIWLRVALLVLCRFCVTIEITAIYGYTLELYPTVVRNVGIGSCSTFARIGAIAAPFMKDLVGLHTRL
ncbi:organic cation transporter protein-like [Centruroides sculpturatus]|uniref:organic cation transporter protein-like n=1 Tax=Centruroides sculpturatus TaxID=218467 RepID=UPI000C6D44F4|nr:organic cation transporter protein-like [Centruroides sculpturatus]